MTIMTVSIHSYSIMVTVLLTNSNGSICCISRLETGICPEGSVLLELSTYIGLRDEKSTHLIYTLLV